MRSNRLMSALALPLALGVLLNAGHAQGKGQSGGGSQKPEKAQGQGRGADQGRVVKQTKPDQPSPPGRLRRADDNRGRGNESQGPADAGRGRVGGIAPGPVSGAARGEKESPIVRESGGNVEMRGFRTFAASDKRGQRLAGLAVARANKRGLAEDALVITPVGRRTQVLNSAGVVLLDLDDDRDIGSWKVVTAPFLNREGSPSFCRSGEGHPVWGRQWCVEKGFGLGAMDDARWARVIDLGDVRIRPRPEAELARDVLVDVLGDVVFNRLAAHAITLGLAEPLTGRWIGEPAGSRVLLLTSGGRPVAEIVDVDRDDRVEMLIVAVRP